MQSPLSSIGFPPPSPLELCLVVVSLSFECAELAERLACLPLSALCLLPPISSFPLGSAHQSHGAQ